MLRPTQLVRLLHINIVLFKHGLDDLILAMHLFRPVRWVLYLLPWNWFVRSRKLSRGERIRKSLEELGPIFVKFGQMLSTRRDLLPDDIADELAKLQDNVPPFPSEHAQRIIEEALGKTIFEAFDEFDEAPLASASIAQVHSARLPDGKQVVVKVVRPNIQKVIRRDLDLLHSLAYLAERYWKEGRRLRVRDVVKEYEKTILDELDLMREAASASQLRRNFQDSSLLYVPEVHWSYSRRQVMVMERITGIPISNIDLLKESNVDLKRLAEEGVEIFFTQVFRHSFFHADMHPGNIFVGEGGQYIAVDFGIMGTLNPDDQRYLAENFLAFFQRDYRRVAELHIESGWVPQNTRVDEFESAIRTVCEPIFERPLKDISFGYLLLRLFQTAQRFDMEVQPQLVLLQKTLLNIEGLGRQLYPELDLWKTAKPFLERWMSEQVGPRGFLKTLRNNATSWAEKLPAMPAMLHDVMRTMKEGKLEAEWRNGELEKLRKDLAHGQRRTYRAIVGGTFVLAAAVLISSDSHNLPMLGNAPLLSWLLAGVGAVVLIFSWPSKR